MELVHSGWAPMVIKAPPSSDLVRHRTSDHYSKFRNVCFRAPTCRSLVARVGQELAGCTRLSLPEHAGF
jgi:hypothetical protein